MRGKAVEGPGDVRDKRHAKPTQRACRGFLSRGCDVRAAPLPYYEAARTGQLCAPRDRAEVLRIGNTIEHDNKVRASEVIEGQIPERRGQSHSALMDNPLGQPVKLASVCPAHRHACRAGGLRQAVEVLVTSATRGTPLNPLVVRGTPLNPLVMREAPLNPLVMREAPPNPLGEHDLVQGPAST